MKKPAVIRNDIPHEVSIVTGSNVAKSKTTELYKDFEAEPPPTVIVKAKAAAASSPTRGRAKLKKNPADAEPARSKTARARVSAAAAREAPASRQAIDPAALWSPNSPTAVRINDLQVRNATLDEQIQRLNEALRLRGKTP